MLGVSPPLDSDPARLSRGEPAGEQAELVACLALKSDSFARLHK